MAEPTFAAIVFEAGAVPREFKTLGVTAKHKLLRDFAERGDAIVREHQACGFHFRVMGGASASRPIGRLSASGFVLRPVVLGDVEHDAVDVLELPFGIDAGILGQLHEELTAIRGDLFFSRLAVLDNETKVMQASPVKTTLAAVGAFREMQQRQVHDAVRQRDGIANGGFTSATRFKPNTVS